MARINTLDKDGWYAGNMETEGHRIDEPGTGKPIIMRQYKFMFPPGMKRKPKKDELLTPAFIKHMENQLWGDNLEMVTDPKIVINKKGFIIFATCQAKRGNILSYMDRERLKPLQDKLKDEREPQ